MHSWVAESDNSKQRSAHYAIDGLDGTAFHAGLDPLTNMDIFSFDNCFKSSADNSRWLKVIFNWVYVVEAVVLQVRKMKQNIVDTSKIFFFKLQDRNLEIFFFHIAKYFESLLCQFFFPGI